MATGYTRLMTSDVAGKGHEAMRIRIALNGVQLLLEKRCSFENVISTLVHEMLVSKD